MSKFSELMQQLEREQAIQSRISEAAFPVPSQDSDALQRRRAASHSSPSLGSIALLRWRLISLCTVGCIVLSGLVTLILPKKYQSEVQFLVKNERQDLTITPEQNASSPAQSSELNEEQVNSEMQMLLSHDLLEGVVRDNHLYQPFLKNGDAPDRRAIELAVMKLNKNLDVTAIRKTNIIQAKYRTNDPYLAADVMKDLSRRYLNAHLAAHSTPGSYDFFLTELAGYRDRLNKAEVATSEFRRSSQIFNSDQQRAALVTQLEDVNARFENADADLQERKARIAAVTTEDNAASLRIPTDERTSVNQLTVDHLQAELADMENRHIEYLAKFRPTDRAIQELEAEMANTRKNLAAAKVEYAAEKTTTVNPLHQTLTAMQSDNRVDVRALQARRAALLELQKTYVAELKKFDENAVTLANLQQDEAIAQQNYLNYSKRFEEARLADQMDKEKFANVVMIETPVPSPIAVSPVMAANLLLGAMFGLILGFSIAFLQPQKQEVVSGAVRLTNHPLIP
jgi:uncharacterized protein involved in exopolysaccharide biosynthesis